MKTPLQITCNDIEHADVIKSAIHKNTDKLELFYRGITIYRIVFKILNKHHYAGKINGIV